MEFYLVFSVFYVHLVHIFPPNFGMRRHGIQEVSGSICLILLILSVNGNARRNYVPPGVFSCNFIFQVSIFPRCDNTHLPQNPDHNARK